MTLWFLVDFGESKVANQNESIRPEPLFDRESVNVLPQTKKRLVRWKIRYMISN